MRLLFIYMYIFSSFFKYNVYLFILNSSTIFLLKSLESKYLCNLMWGRNIGKLEAFIVFVYNCCDWLKCFDTKKTTLKIEFNQFLFHTPAFHRVINSPSETQPFQCGVNILPQNNRKWYSSYLDHYLNSHPY